MKKIIALVLALALVLSLPVFAFAEGSPSGDPEYRVQIINVDGGTATGEKNADGSYTVTVTVKDGYKFNKWTIEGDYELVDCDIDDETVTFTYSSDITITPVYTKEGTSSGAGSVDTGSGSPDTSDNNSYTLVAVSLLAVIAIAGVFLLKNKVVTE